MTSYQFKLDQRRRFVGRRIAAVRRELQKAFIEEKRTRKFTQAELARVLGVNRSVVNRQLMGTANLSVKSLADLAWALGRDFVVGFPKRKVAVGSNASPIYQVPSLGVMPDKLNVTLSGQTSTATTTRSAA